MAYYVVVHFEDENDNSVEAIPKSWIQKGNKFGYWPPFRSTGQIKNAIKNATEPVVGVWKLCRLRVLQQYGTLEAARKHSKTAEYQSNLESDHEKVNRKQITKRKQYSDVDNLDYLSEIEKPSQEQYDEHRLPPIPALPGAIFEKMHGNNSGKSQIHDRLGSSKINIQNTTEKKKYEKLDKFTLDSVSNVSDKWHSKSPGLSMLQGETDQEPFEDVSTSFNTKSSKNQDDHPTLLHLICARLTKIEQKLDTCLAQQKMILNVVGSSDIPVALPANISLPLRTIVQLEHLELILLEKASMDAVIMHLGQIGGRTVAETVKNVLSEVMVTEVAQQINFEGRRGQKKGIKNMKILSAIYGAVQHNPYTKNATKAEISDYVKTWLRNSCDRKKSDGSGGRKRHTVDNSNNKRLRTEDSQLCDKEGHNDVDDDEN